MYYFIRPVKLTTKLFHLSKHCLYHGFRQIQLLFKIFHFDSICKIKNFFPIDICFHIHQPGIDCITAKLSNVHSYSLTIFIIIKVSTDTIHITLNSLLIFVIDRFWYNKIYCSLVSFCPDSSVIFRIRICHIRNCLHCIQRSIKHIPRFCCALLIQPVLICTCCFFDCRCE